MWYCVRYVCVPQFLHKQGSLTVDAEQRAATGRSVDMRRRLLLNDCTASYSSVPLVEVLLSCHIYPPTLSVKRLACRLRSTHPALRCMGCASSALVAGACGAVRLTLCGTGARADHRAAVQVPAILQDRVQCHQPKPGTGAASVPRKRVPGSWSTERPTNVRKTWI